MNEKRSKVFRQLITAASMGLAQKQASGALPVAEAVQAMELLEALQAGRFHFAAETWHDTHENNGHQIYPAEMLLRALDREGHDIKPLAPITTISRAGLQMHLDQAVIIACVDQALQENQMPISINTSARNMASTHFWTSVSAILKDCFTAEEIKGKLTFEVTEDDLASNPCRELLLSMKREIGCSFAVDDFYHDHAFCDAQGAAVDSFDWERLENLKEIVDYVKIDGETVEASLSDDQPFDLAALIDKIKLVAPNVHIILERIKDADEAYLFSNVSDAVQGMRLTNNRDDFGNQLKIASCNPLSVPKGLKKL